MSSRGLWSADIVDNLGLDNNDNDDDDIDADANDYVNDDSDDDGGDNDNQWRRIPHVNPLECVKRKRKKNRSLKGRL